MVLFSSASVIDFIDPRFPPGVSTAITNACAPSLSAVAIVLVRKRSEAGLVSVLSTITSTCGDAAETVRADMVRNKETITTMIVLARRSASARNWRCAWREYIMISLQQVKERA